MNWFRRKKETAVPGTVQLRSGERHPFGMLADYVPLQNGELQLYRAGREAVPVVDAAIYKLIRMTCGVRATCQDAAAQRQLQTFLRTAVPPRLRQIRPAPHQPGPWQTTSGRPWRDPVLSWVRPGPCGYPSSKRPFPGDSPGSCGTE